MRGTFTLGRIAGIRITANWTVLVIAALVTATVGGTLLPRAVDELNPAAAWALGLLSALLLLGSIAAHELGHAITARRAGITTDEITLWLFGGVAKLTADATTPSDEMRIAVAGPAVSATLAVSAAAAATLGSVAGLHLALIVVLAYLALVNGSLAIFNMIPGLPLDGGRVLRGYLWKRRDDRLSATITAARLGRFLGAALMVWGLWTFLGGGSGLWTAAIGYFIRRSATAELREAQVQRLLETPLGTAVGQMFARVYGAPGNGTPVNGTPVNGAPVNGSPIDGSPIDVTSWETPPTYPPGTSAESAASGPTPTTDRIPS